MPTVEELGQKVKAKYPGSYDDIGDADLGKKVKAKFPGSYDDFTESRFPQAGEVRQRARKHLAEELPKVGAEQAERIYKEADLKESVRAAEMLPFVLAAPFTGGASLAAGAAIMGGAGLAGGIGREALTGVMTGETKSRSKLAASLGFDFAMGAGSELGFRAIGGGVSGLIEKGLGAGRTQLPKLVMEAASKFPKGTQMLESAYEANSASLAKEVGNRMINVSKPFKNLDAGLERLVAKGAVGRELTSDLSPQALRVQSALRASKEAEAAVKEIPGQIAGREATAETVKGKVAQVEQDFVKEGYESRLKRSTKPETIARLTGEMEQSKNVVKGMRGLSEKAQGFVTELEDAMVKAKGEISSRQPMDGIIRIRGGLDKIARETKGAEKRVFENASRELDEVIQKQIADNPKAMAFHKTMGEIAATRKDRDAVVEIGTGMIAKKLARLAGKSVLGGAIGYEGGGVKGAMVGAAAGAAYGAASQKVTLYALQRVLATPQAAGALTKAARLLSSGNKAAAIAALDHGFEVAGINQALRKVGSLEELTGPAPTQVPAGPIGPQPQQVDYTPK